jgi:hypothetical protein
MAPGLITAQTRIYQIKIELRDVRPSVWRRVLVPDAMTLGELHEVVQRAMGWQDCHLHEFEVDALRFGIPDPENDDDDLFDDATAALGLVAGERSELFYLYDFGDCWAHTLTVEAALAPEPGARYPRCVDGARPCPPENIGGPHRYVELLGALRDPGHPEHEAVVSWADEFDLQAFEPAGADKRLESLAWLNGA